MKCIQFAAALAVALILCPLAMAGSCPAAVVAPVAVQAQVYAAPAAVIQPVVAAFAVPAVQAVVVQPQAVYAAPLVVQQQQQQQKFKARQRSAIRGR